jgi:hypothetical protein
MKAFHGAPESEWKDWAKAEITKGGDGTILYFVTDLGGAYLFWGDARDKSDGKLLVKTIEDCEVFFSAEARLEDREVLERCLTGDGALSLQGTRQELWDWLGLPD